MTFLDEIPNQVANILFEKKEYLAKCDKKLCTLAGQLQGCRQARGVSLRKLAKRIKVSAAFVSDVELGRRKLTIDFADRFVEALAKEKRKGMSGKTANSKHH